MENTQKVSLTDFLNARLNEDEAAAKAALGVTTGSRYGGQPREWVNFWSIRGPEQTIREVEAKRAIIRWHEVAVTAPEPIAVLTQGIDAGFRRGTGDALAALATAYNYHPDYRREWET